MSVSQALDHFISSYGDLDEALREYACNLIDDVDDDSGGEEVVEQLGELLSGACPRFASAPDAERTQAVLELFQAARRGCGGASSSGAAPGGGGALAESVTAEAVVARMRQMQLDALAAEGGCLPRTSSSGGGAGGGGVGGCSSSGAAPSAAAAAPDDVENADPQALAALRELCSDVASDTFLAYILVRRHAGDTEAAAAWLIEQGDVASLEASWREALAEESAAAATDERERARSKAAILARFDLQVVRDPGDARRSRPLEAWAAGSKPVKPQGGSGGKVRYRDGAIVTTSGDKYIIEKPPEFDGGSRGKVYTKGKRGKGFV